MLDDPLAGLDFKLRESLMDDLKDMRAELGATFLYATSDPLEALTVAERLIVLDAGRIVETGTVEDIYYAPAHLRTAEPVGYPRCNVLRGRLKDDLRHRARPLRFGRRAAAGARRCHRHPAGARRLHPQRQGAWARHPRHRQHPADGKSGAESIVYLDVPEGRLVTTPPTRAMLALDVGSRSPSPSCPKRSRCSMRRAARASAATREVAMPDIRLEHLTCCFGATVAVNDITTIFAEGSVTCLLGRSGCGKTTLLRMIAGLERPTAGRVFFGERDVTDLRARRRDVAMVFQYPVMYPTLSVVENIELPLRSDRSLSAADRRTRVEQVLGCCSRSGARRAHGRAGRPRASAPPSVARWPGAAMWSCSTSRPPTSMCSPTNSGSAPSRISAARCGRR